ncbi:hypothetical protein [Nocardioides zhouii]|uniref:Uncharacterized protein n=1 Tax=Nocardioides zhouii TaxID=1168729 RepID=A0A4Q2TAM4_9ACTN|nr:hypothetical protein [Nocardioides zhouii]RYC14300.1 hypothetical protein EUA94_03075 [Nocardioides zhouii]
MRESLTSRSDATTSDLSDAPPRTGSRVGRRIGVAVLITIVLAAGFDALGPRAGDTSAVGGGYAVGLEYAQIARAGEPAPLTLTITTDTGFGDSVQVRFCSTYFDHLDFQSWYPNPSAETSEADWVVYEFDPPPAGRSLRVALDARVAPGQLGGLDRCEVSVLDKDEPVVTATWTTWRMP